MYETFLFCLGFLGIAWVSAQAPQCDSPATLPFFERRGVNIPTDPNNLLCDNNLVEQWYRIDAGLPLERVERGLCGTVSTAWYNGALPTALGENVEGQVCLNVANGPVGCDASITINVTRCNGYDVYYLVPLTSCQVAYCVAANTTGDTAEFPTTPGGPDPATITAVQDPTSTTAAQDPASTTAAQDPAATTAAQDPAASTTDVMTADVNCTATLLRPWVSAFGNGPLCDLSDPSTNCEKAYVSVLPNSPVVNSSNLECRIRGVLIGETGPEATLMEYVVPATFIDCYSVICPLPSPETLPPLEGLVVRGWQVAVSNENQEFGVEKLFLTYPSDCVSCTVIPGPPTCYWNDTYCYINGTCVPDGMINPYDSCEQCRPNVSLSSWSVTAGFCNINGTCIASGTAKLDEPCLVCLPGESATSYVDAPLVCNISNTCVPQDGLDPDNACRRCDANVNENDWTERQLELRSGGTATCTDVCSHVTAQIPTMLQGICTFPPSLVHLLADAFLDVCYLSDPNDLPPNSCDGQSELIQRFQNVCAHVPGDPTAAQAASCP